MTEPSGQELSQQKKEDRSLTMPSGQSSWELMGRRQRLRNRFRDMLEEAEDLSEETDILFQKHLNRLHDLLALYGYKGI